MHEAQATMLERLDAIEEHLACSLYWQRNLGLRVRNRGAAVGTTADSGARQLQPLLKENQPAAGGAAAGSLPPAGLFPATRNQLFRVRIRAAIGCWE